MDHMIPKPVEIFENPKITLPYSELPEAKEWSIGGNYELTIAVRPVSINREDVTLEVIGAEVPKKVEGSSTAVYGK